MNSLFESVDALFSSDKSVIEGYSLGDDKESFDVWDKEGKKLEEICKYLEDYCDINFSDNMEVEHSQDSIYTADFTLKNLPESALDKEDELYDKYRDISYINNIQISKWYGDEIVCFIGFDIDGAYNRKSELGRITKDINSVVRG